MQSSLTDIIYSISQALLIPVALLLLLAIAYALFCIGSCIMEYFTERRSFKENMPVFLASLMDASEAATPEIIAESKLLNRQKSALLTVYDYRTLPGDALLALIRREVNVEETRYNRITGRNNLAAKVSPMLGLMGTLIPLGPGVAALGQADTSALSSSLLVAFSTTVIGLAVAAVCLAVAKIRGNWYDDYLSALDSGMATLLQKIENMRENGQIKTQEPSSYAFLFEQGLKGRGAKSASTPVASRAASAPATSTQTASASATPATSAPTVPSTPATPAASAPAAHAAPGASASPSITSPTPRVSSADQARVNTTPPAAGGNQEGGAHV